MGWKEWPYWIKGGILLSALSIIFAFLLIPFGNYYPTDIGSPYWGIILLRPSYVIIDFLQNTGLRIYAINDSLYSFFKALVISLILYFLFGSLIGWIYGKIKAKK